MIILPENESKNLLLNHLLAVERVDEEADEAIVDKIAGGEAVRNKIAGGKAAGDKTAKEGEAILEAADRVDEFIVDPSIEAVLRPKVEGPGIEIDEFERRV